MRIKELAKCAKDDGALTLLDEVDEDGEVVRQYVMLPNRAIYPLDGMPMLNEQTLLTVMDVPREKHSLYEVVRSVMPERARLMVEDAKLTDTQLRRGTWSLGMNGLTLTPVFRWDMDADVWFVETELLKVLADERGVELAMRKVDGSAVIVAMVGMVTVACFVPTSAHWRKDEAWQMHLAGRAGEKVYHQFCDAEGNYASAD